MRSQGGAVDHSQPSLNPTGGDALRRDATQPALHDDLMERVLDSENMRRAWKRVKANKGAPGIDGMRIEDFAEFARSHWPAIRQALRDGSYQPQPVRRVTIPKPQRGRAVAGHPHRGGPGDPAGHRASSGADLRSGVFGIELRLPAGTLRPRSTEAGTSRSLVKATASPSIWTWRNFSTTSSTTS